MFAQPSEYSFGERNHMRAPTQRRSRQSTDRMLDAALRILERDGLDGLTIAAVAREANVGVGTIYHRFSDRKGLLNAAQDRFMTRLERKWEEVTSAAHGLGDDEFLYAVMLGTTQSYIARRNTFHAFIVTYNDDPVLRDRFTEAGRLIGSYFLAEVVRRFGCSQAAAATAYRMMFADGTVEAMFSPDEVEPAPLALETRIRLLQRAASAMLRSSSPADDGTNRP